MAKKSAPTKKSPIKKVTKKAVAKKVVKKPAAKAHNSVKSSPKKSVVKSKPKPVVKKQAKPIAKKATKPAPKKAVKKETIKPAAKATKTASKPVAISSGRKDGGRSRSKSNLRPPITRIKPVNVEPKFEGPTMRLGNKILPKPELHLPVQRQTAPPPKKRSTVDNSRNRYTDKELQEFKTLIEEKLEAAKSELKNIQATITKDGENGTEDTENRFGGMEDGAGTLEREFYNQMATRQGTYIDHLEKALMRIENKTYGICRVTGKLISKERLLAVPHATLSLEAKEMKK